MNPQAQRWRGPGLLVLVVDDSQDSVDTAAVLLELLGHRTLTATRGEVALELAETHFPDVVLLDIHMPGMSGVDVARRLPRHPDGRRPFVIATTGLPSGCFRVAEGTVDLVLPKPYDLGVLEAVLKRFRVALVGQLVACP